MYKSYLLLLLLFLFYGCKHSEDIKENTDVIHIDYRHAVKKPLSEIPDSVLGVPQFILVKEKSNELICQQFDKIKYAVEKFFVLDRRLRKLIVCDKWGNAVNKVGNRGKGPDEYLGIADFDVDSQGNVYCLDGQLDKLFVYHSDFSVKSVQALPFEADAISVADNGNMLFGLSSWNKKEGKGHKILLTDKDLHVRYSGLPYDEYKDDNYWISWYSFTRYGGYAVYNQPIDNHVYLFDPEDFRTWKSYLFDFGSRNVPDEHKKDIEKHLKDFEHYSLLKSPAVVTPDYVAGTLLDGRQTRFFVFDIRHGISYEGEKTDEYDNSQIVGYCEPYLISVLESQIELPDDCAYPDSVKNHLLQEGRVIVLCRLGISG